MTAPSIKLDAKKLSSQIAGLRAIAKQEKWTVYYDDDVDQLFFTPKVIPKDSFLVTFNDDISLYLTKNSEIKGLFIEYFSHNFVRHDKDIKPAVDILFDGTENTPKDKKLAKEVVIKELELKTIEAVLKDLSGKMEFAVAV